MRRAPARTLVLGTALLTAAAAAARAATRMAGAAASELAEFRPQRSRVPLPTDAGALGLQPVRVPVPGAAAISGWYVPTRNGAAVVLAHGSGGDRREVLDVARALVRGGYGALLFDWPGHGESDGSIRFGEPERRALHAAIRYALGRPGVAADRVGVYGFSSGAFLAVQVAAADRHVRALALAAPPGDVVAYTRHEYAGGGRLAQWGALLGLRLGGMRLDEPQPAALVAGLAPRPLLIVTGTVDPNVPPAAARALYDAARAPKRLWLIAGAEHGGYERVLPGYGAGVREFFDEALAPPAASR